MKNVWTFIGIVLIVILVFVLLVGGIGMMAFSGFGARGMMGRLGGIGMMGGLGLFRFVVPCILGLLVIGGIIALAVWFARGGARTFAAATTTSMTTPTLETPLEILKARYARGEITKEQYDAMRQDLA